MNPRETLEALSDRFKVTAHVNTVFGEPRTIEGKTIIPVAKVAYGLGAGGGEGRQGPADDGPSERSGSEGGGGGGVTAGPVGFIVVDSEGEHFVHIGPSRRQLIEACFAGFVLGVMIGRRGRR